MDTVTVVIIIIAAVVVFIGVVYCMRKRRQGRFQDDVKRALQLELEQRLEELDAAVHRTVLEALSHFPALDTQDEDDASPVVAQLLRAADEIVGAEGVPLLDAVELHAALLANKAVLQHCEKGTTIFYNALDMLLQSEVGQVLRVGGQEELEDRQSIEARRVRRSGCLYRLCCVHRSWEDKQLKKKRRVWFYNLAHRVCCGRTGQERAAHAAASSDEDVDVDVELGLRGAQQRKYLYTGGVLKRHYAEVTKDAQPFVYIDNEGDVMVSATDGMWSKHETAGRLAKCFSSHVVIDARDDRTCFSGHQLREDIYTYLHNIDHLVSNVTLSVTARRSHDEIVQFDSEVKQWAQCVQQKLCIRVASKWSRLVEQRSYDYLRAPDIVARMAARSMESASETQRRVTQQPLRTDAILRKFWETELARFTRALMCECSDALRGDSVKRCCGYCLPLFPLIDKDFSDDQAVVAEQLNARLGHRVWLCRMREDEIQNVTDALGRTKQRITENLLVRPRHIDEGPAATEGDRAVTPAGSVDERAAFLDGPPTAPARTDVVFTPRNSDDGILDRPPPCALQAVAGDVVRGIFDVLQGTLDVLVNDLEAECAALFLQEMMSGGAVAATQQEIQQITAKAAADVRKHAAEVSVMSRVYHRTRALCLAGRSLSQHASELGLEGLTIALYALRDVLLEAKDARNHFESGDESQKGADTTGGAGLWMLFEQPASTEADVVTGKRQLLFPWHRILVSYNFYAQLLQKQPITLQFIYS